MEKPKTDLFMFINRAVALGAHHDLSLNVCASERDFYLGKLAIPGSFYTIIKNALPNITVDQLIQLQEQTITIEAKQHPDYYENTEVELITSFNLRDLFNAIRELDPSDFK